jgi:uncharacterized protein (DUF1501 family)
LSRKLSRRDLMRNGAHAAALGVTLVAERAALAEAPGAALAPECVVLVCLRGGADALSCLIPYRNDDYYRARPRIAIGRRKKPDQALQLDDQFALHPKLAPLAPLYARGELGFVLGAGFSPRLALHGEAQRRLDSTHAAATGGSRPEVWSGSFAEQCGHAGERLLAGALPRAIRLESFGWDTHLGQGGANSGRLSVLLGELAAGLVRLRSAIRDGGERATLLVASEFGRTVTENHVFGTDDGHGQLVLLLAAPGRCGRIPPRPLDLRPDALCDGRSLPVSAELPTVLAKVASGKAP